MNLVGAVPEYQENGKCKPDKVNSLALAAGQCGIFFNFTHWNEPTMISVSAGSDHYVTVQNKIMNVRMYVNAQKVSDDVNLKYWNNYILPDLKVSLITK